MGIVRQRSAKRLRACRTWVGQIRRFPPRLTWPTPGNDEPRCTIVSAHFDIKSKHDGRYLEWFENSMRIDCPLVFFAERETIELVKTIRRDLPTVYVESSLADCLTYRYANQFKTHERHAPSKELAVIWHEKVNFVNKAAQMNPFETEFFAWMDSGHSMYRTTRHPKRPWPDRRKLGRLPVDRVMISTSANRYDADRLSAGDYVHFIAGGSYLLHKETVRKFHAAYYRVLEDVLRKFPGRIVGSSDQCVLSHLCIEDPDLFHVLCRGYGATIPLLY